MTTAFTLRSDLVLGIESSCDDTAAAVVQAGRRVLSSVVASQEEIHALFGGVVPEVASRKHVEVITRVVQEALDRAGCTWDSLGGLAVTNGPGLIGSLLVGVSAAKAYALATGLPLVGVNHIAAHLMSSFCDLPEHDGAPEEFPLVCLVASGGHSDLCLLTGLGQYEVIGLTRDDAAGEALDKAARLLGLGYPGGPALERAAREGEARFDLPRPVIAGSYDFSFSGLKSALVRLIEGLQGESATALPVPDLACSFQQAVVDTLVRNVARAAMDHGARQILLAGGVAANAVLRRELAAAGERLGLPVRYPPLRLCTDNAAMVAAAGYQALIAGQQDGPGLDVFSALHK
jgi:N6-L-threonylcarbamoyladenine synthase